MIQGYFVVLFLRIGITRLYFFVMESLLDRLGGQKSIIICHDMVMAFGFPFNAAVTITTGPGSSSWYTFERGNVCFSRPAILDFCESNSGKEVDRKHC